MQDISYVDTNIISEKTILLRVDLNLSLHPDHSIADDARLKQILPTVHFLLEKKNKLVIVSHLGRPKGEDLTLTLLPVFERLQAYLSQVKSVFIPDFLHAKDAVKQALRTYDIAFLENIRFYEGEEKNDSVFAKSLASLADIYVNDAFSVSHRASASIVGVAQLLPSYGGLLLRKEVIALTKVVDNPAHPFVAVVGGGKIATKIHLLKKLTKIADHVLVGGGLANTLLLAEGKEVGKSLVEKDMLSSLAGLVKLAQENRTELIVPSDVIVGTKDGKTAITRYADSVETGQEILDIGPETKLHFCYYLQQAETIVWNGPMGYFENPQFSRGTEAMYQAIVENTHAFSVVGGGETLTAIKNEAHLDHISHISTAGGAMLEFIENGTLPGLDALKKQRLSV